MVIGTSSERAPQSSSHQKYTVSSPTGALITFTVLAVLAFRTIRAQYDSVLNQWGWILIIILFLQIALGIGNVLLSLPLGIAVAHNGVGALLLLVVVTLNFLVRVKSEAL